MLELMAPVKTFFGWRAFLSKKLIIKALIAYAVNPSILTAVSDSDDLLEEFHPFMASYISKVTPFPNVDLTLLDVWSYSFGTDIFEDYQPTFHEYLDKTPIEALNNCILNKIYRDVLATSQNSFSDRCATTWLR